MRRTSVRRIAVHLIRLALVLTVVVCIRVGAARTNQNADSLQLNPDALASVESLFPGSTTKPFDSRLGGNPIQSPDGTIVGYLLQTSPVADKIVGYSGPTNVLLVFDTAHQIVDASILNSADTWEHVAAIIEDPNFLNSFQGINANTETDWNSIDAVSGATLTCRAIVASVALRMGDELRSIKFRLTPDLNNVQKIFPAAKSLNPRTMPSLFDVLDGRGTKLGSLLTTTPVADNVVGYQGPTATLIGFDATGLFVGLAIDQSYDNEKYVGYVEEDYQFPTWFQAKRLAEIAGMDASLPDIEGVSGATMTSVAVAQGIVAAARSATEQPSTPASRPTWTFYVLDGLTILLTLIGISFSFSKMSKHKWLRRSYQLILVLVVGFLSGHILSQASLVGWATHGLPWRVAPGLVCMGLAAFIVPVVSRHQPYCHHICPFGAMQQWARTQSRWKIKLRRKWSRRLKTSSGFLIVGLLGIAVWTGVTEARFNLASLEPFNAFTFRIAGWATLAIFAIGLGTSFFLPMAYCRFACPTGRVLGFLRFNSDSHRLGLRDLAAFLLATFAFLLLFV